MKSLLDVNTKSEKTLDFGHSYAPDGKQNSKIIEYSRVVAKGLSVLFVVDTHWEV